MAPNYLGSKVAYKGDSTLDKLIEEERACNAYRSSGSSSQIYVCQQRNKSVCRW